MQVMAADFDHGASAEWRRSRQEEVADAAERVHIDARVHGAGTREALRCHEERRARNGIGPREVGSFAAVDTLHQPEVDDLDVLANTASGAEKNVARLDVAMDDTRVVRFAERARDL